jgi:predicted N-acetyltransferase YhbS
MTISHRVAEPADLDRLRPLLDNEFITSKGRKTSLAQRFPSTFCAANAHNIFLAEDQGKILSAFLCKRFDWQAADRVWQGAMVGAVFSDPNRRGEGLASNLLKWGMQTLQADGVEFGALWTTQAEFYARLGWVGADVGVFGSSGSGVGTGAAPDSVRVLPAVLSSDRDMDDIRTQYLDASVRRELLDYSQQPIPAESVDVLLWADDGEPSAYALLGHMGATGILYEMVGSERGFADLWETIRRRHKRCVINDYAGSASHRWLAQHSDIDWEDKKLAMWLPLTAELDIAKMSGWYIPYFDRI